MARKKKAETEAAKVIETAVEKVEAKVEETKAAVEEKKAEVEEKVEEKKAAKKAAAKKAPAKKAAPQKTAPKKPEEAKVNFFVEFGGVQVALDKVIADIKATYGKDAKEFSVYLKPDESKAYFVADGTEGVIDVFFC